MVAGSRPSPAVVFGGVRRSRHNYPVVLKHGIARPAAIRRKRRPIGQFRQKWRVPPRGGKTAGRAPASVVESRKACDPGMILRPNSGIASINRLADRSCANLSRMKVPFGIRCEKRITAD